MGLCYYKRTPGVKKSSQELKSLVEKVVNQYGRLRPSAFDRIKFDHHDLTTKHCYFGCSRSPDVDGIKIFDKDNQAANIKIKTILWPGYLYQKI